MRLNSDKIKLITLFIWVLMPFLTRAQLSPGDLSNAHAHLEGISNCTLCHVLNQKVSNEKCLDCHTLINDRIKSNKGFHVSDDVKGKDCFSCHNEHHGRKFQLIRFDTLSFDHNKAGYRLEGAHLKVSCSECHQPSFIPDNELKKRENTYLGLSSECLNCHEDYHQNTLSVTCTQSHSFDSFKEAPNFNHNNTAFVLKGKHQEVSCEKCHPITVRNEMQFQVFKGIEFENCTDCHKDVHDNKFGQDCKKCHTENSFHAIVGMSTFNHDRTNFKLEGKHRSVDCKKCHKTSLTTPLDHNYCMDCHDDYHESQFIKNGNLPDCANCHSVEGFKPSTYTLENHQQSNFVLEGAHLATPCFSCHLKENKWQFRNLGLHCAQCHTDTHSGYLPEKYYPKKACNNCHSSESWKKINFDHSLTKYPLTGSHKKPSCIACHNPNEKNNDQAVQFSNVPTACVGCHKDEHAGQFVEKGTIDCSRCHENTTWDKIQFDHNKSRFVLDGKHSNISCTACHKPATINGIRTIQYKFEDIRCESCH